MNDDKLVRTSLEGDRKAFRKLVDRYARRIYSFCRRYAANCEDAKDLSQEVFVTAFKALPNLRRPNGFSAWLFGIARNHCKMYLRRLESAKVTAGGVDDETSSAVDVDEYLRLESLRYLMHDLMRQLTPEQREVVELFYWGGLTYDEICAALDLPKSTVKSRLFEARRSLKDVLSRSIRNAYRTWGLPVSFAEEVVARCGEGCECGLTLESRGGV